MFVTEVFKIPIGHWLDVMAASTVPGETVNGYDVQRADGQCLSIELNGSTGNPQDVHTTVGDPENPALKEVERKTLSPLPNSKVSNGNIQPVIPPINNTV
ncbi:hypothetical protein DPMN_190453 [Dreissena polymorpha]|uniref:Uncharacterized protein n=1 Tax=Dreissena polymorpha TaxID=45954 RepID=A0A9D4IBZ5_DREPO|nr:hypothetical protein DPMN_190453 [Dreissena polymorpha]